MANIEKIDRRYTTSGLCTWWRDEAILLAASAGYIISGYRVLDDYRLYANQVHYWANKATLLREVPITVFSPSYRREASLRPHVVF